ncbi:MAG: helix-turn-helix transcriptional regulator [Tannerellaceae bacterium]
MKNIKLVETRKKVGLTQAEIAKKTNISAVSYQRIEYGTQEPGVQKAILITDTLGIRSYKQFKALFGAATPDKPDSNSTM